MKQFLEKIAWAYMVSSYLFFIGSLWMRLGFEPRLGLIWDGDQGITFFQLLVTILLSPFLVIQFGLDFHNAAYWLSFLATFVICWIILVRVLKRHVPSP